MNDIEDRLRTSLGDLADGVPPSPHARADLDRRLTRHRAKRSTLAIAAAAAVVVAGVAIPVAINRGGGESGQRAATAATSTTFPPATGSKPLGDNKVIIARYTEYGIEKSSWLVPKGDRFCLVELVPPGQSDSRPNECNAVPTWSQQEPMTLVHSFSVFGPGLPASSPLSNRLLFVTAPNVETLEVTAGAGDQADVSLLARRPEATYFMAVFPGTYAGFGYTAKDAAGNVLETAIT